MNTDTKKCKRCGIPKSLDEFYEHPAGRMGRMALCIACTSEELKEKYKFKHLLTKPKCLLATCPNRIGIYKRKFCSQKCEYKEQWIRERRKL